MLEKPQQNFELTDYAELWRPQYHYSTLDSRVNDPNGLVYYKGVYHLYYQCFPHAVRSENPHTTDYLRRYRQLHPYDSMPGQHWGHATSTDLIHWQEQPNALFPDDVGYMWSGTAVVDTENTSGFFTNTEEKQGIVVAYSTNTQHIGIAYSTDDGRTFTKVSTTLPVLKNPGISIFRDPHIFWHTESKLWKMVVAGKGGKMWIYEAADLVNWKLCSVDEHINTECPNLFKIPLENSSEEKWILMCVGRGYYVGEFDGIRFIPQTEYIALNEGPDCYAGITFSNMPNGRTVMISWINAYNTVADGKWNGCFTVPVELKLIFTNDSYRLIQTTVPEFSLLKKQRLLSVDKKCYKDENPLAHIFSNSFVLTAQINVENSGNFSLSFCKSEEEETLLSYDKYSGCISIDRHKTKFGLKAFKTKESLFSFYVDPKTMCGGNLDIRLMVDVSNIELFVNNGYYYFVSRIQPFTSSKSMALLYDGTLALDKLTVESCSSIWFEDPRSCGSVHLSNDATLVVAKGATNSERMVAELYDRDVVCSGFDTSLVSVAIENNVLKVSGISEGNTVVKLSSGRYYRLLSITVIESDDISSQNGALTDSQNAAADAETFIDIRKHAAVTEGYSGRIDVQKFGSGRGFILSDEDFSEFSLCAKTILFGKGCSGILFNVRDAGNFMCVELDNEQSLVKLWKRIDRTKIEVRTIEKALSVNVSYDLRVVAENYRLKVFLGDDLIMDEKYDFPMSGRIGGITKRCDSSFVDFYCKRI